MRVLEGELNAANLNFALVVSRFNELITERLLEGAAATLRRLGASDENITVAWVPGAVEIPVVAMRLADSGDYHAVITLGAVVKGATSHYDHVSNMVAAGVAAAAERSGVPVTFGVLTTETMEQALDRAGGKVGNKGAEAALAAVELARLLAKL